MPRAASPLGGDERLQGVADVIRQGVGGDVVGLHERRVKQVAQRDRIARLKTNVVLARSGKGGFGNDCDLREIAALFRRPIEHHHRRRDLRQAADLAFLVGLELLQNVAGLGVDRDRCLGRARMARSRQKRARVRERGAGFYEGKRSRRSDRCTVTGATSLGNRNPVADAFVRETLLPNEG